MKTAFAIVGLLAALGAYFVLRERHADGVVGQAFLVADETATQDRSMPAPLGGAHFLVMWRGQKIGNWVDSNSVCLRAQRVTTDSNGLFSAPAWVAPRSWPLVTDIHADTYPFDTRYVAASDRPDQAPVGVKAGNVVYLRHKNPAVADPAIQVIQDELARCERQD